MMQLKCFKELGENLILCSFSTFNVGMHAGVVFVSQVRNCENTVPIEVKRLESPNHDLLSKKTEWALDHPYKLVEVNHAVTVDVKGLE